MHCSKILITFDCLARLYSGVVKLVRGPNLHWCVLFEQALLFKPRIAEGDLPGQADLQ